MDSPATFEGLAAQSGAIIYFIQLLKKSNWVSFINDNSGQLNRFLSVFLTALTTVGLSYHWNPDLGVFTLGGFQTGVAWYIALGQMGWKVLGAITTVHVFYHGAVKDGAPAPKP
jgi:hypothetical protein